MRGNKRVTFDGVETTGPLAGQVVAPVIRLWRNYDLKLKAEDPIVSTVRHGEAGMLIGRKGDGCKVRASDGATGWVTYTFIRELKGSVPDSLTLSP